MFITVNSVLEVTKNIYNFKLQSEESKSVRQNGESIIQIIYWCPTKTTLNHYKRTPYPADCRLRPGPTGSQNGRRFV